MKRIAVLAALIAALTGCPPEGDFRVQSVFRAGSDELLLCGNGAYQLVIADEVNSEGLVVTDYTTPAPKVLTGTDGESGTVAFVLTAQRDGTWTSAELGDDWQEEYPATDLERAALGDVCDRLEQEPWWQ
jgi:hypothetical protein